MNVVIACIYIPFSSRHVIPVTVQKQGNHKISPGRNNIEIAKIDCKKNKYKPVSIQGLIDDIMNYELKDYQKAFDYYHKDI